MAFTPRTTRCLAVLLALCLGLSACAPGPAVLSAPVLAAKVRTATPTPGPTDEAAPAAEVPAPRYSVEAEGPAAEDLSDRCRLDAPRSIQSTLWRISDDALYTSQSLKAGQWVSLTWDEEVPVRAVLLAFRDYPDDYRVQQFDADGVLIREEPGDGLIDRAVFTEPGTRTVTLVADTPCDLSAMYAYGEGVVPNYHPWAPTPEKLDYLIVATHPDDDVLFMGAILPLYTVDRGLEGSVFYAASQNRERKDEAQNGAWVMGLRTAPILGNFPDISPRNRDKEQRSFTEDQVTLYLVRLFRQYRPEVVFSHDVHGEYGHWQHELMAAAVRQAVRLAGKKYYDPGSVKTWGTWQVKKLYLHLYARNRISLPADTPIAAYGGLTPVQIAAAAYRCHRSQLSSGHGVRNEGVYSLSDFGLAYTAVGADTPGVNDPFEHLDPASLVGAAAPAQTPGP